MLIIKTFHTSLTKCTEYKNSANRHFQCKVYHNPNISIAKLTLLCVYSLRYYCP